jgi:sulfur carrier protein ThiS
MNFEKYYLLDTNIKVKDILENSNFDFLSQIVNLNRSFVVKFQDSLLYFYLLTL